MRCLSAIYSLFRADAVDDGGELHKRVASGRWQMTMKNPRKRENNRITTEVERTERLRG